MSLCIRSLASYITREFCTRIEHLGPSLLADPVNGSSPMGPTQVAAAHLPGPRSFASASSLFSVALLTALCHVACKSPASCQRLARPAADSCDLSLLSELSTESCSMVRGTRLVIYRLSLPLMSAFWKGAFGAVQGGAMGHGMACQIYYSAHSHACMVPSFSWQLRQS